MATHKFINDQWTLQDDLGIGRVGDELARLTLEAKAPFTVGVTGKWGSGKTSIMRRAYATLGGEPLRQELAFSEASEEYLDNQNLHYDDEKRIPKLEWLEEVTNVAELTRCVWFSPWQHQNEDNPLIPLLLEIQTQFKFWQPTEQGTERPRQLMLAGATLIERTIDAAASFYARRNIKVATGTTEAVIKAWKQGENELVRLSDGQRFHLLFEDAVKAILASCGNDQLDQERARLIIFIDDLDRCEEGVIIQLLEAIKLYLHSKHCLFVLGLDETAVLDALSRHWQRSDDINREYLEKLFQARIPVPLPVTRRVVKVVKQQLEDNEIKFADKMAEDVEKLLEPNPRKVKNFVNGLVAQWRILDADNWISDDDEEEARRFVMFFYIQQYHRSIWRLLERQPKVLIYLKYVLGRLGATDTPPYDKEFSFGQQRMLIEMIRRAFSHVLPNGTNDFERKEAMHGSQKIDDAVSDFLNRQDRKRSDEHLVQMFEELMEKDTALKLTYLMIDPPNNTENPAQRDATGNHNE